MLSFDDHPLRRLGHAAQQVRVSFLLYAFTAVRVHCCTRSLLYALYTGSGFGRLCPFVELQMRQTDACKFHSISG
jgi:hypothetical protein